MPDLSVVIACLYGRTDRNSKLEVQFQISKECRSDLPHPALPFLIPAYRAALIVALATITFELVTLAWIRWRFFSTGFLRSFVSIAIGGAIIASLSAALGAVS